MLRHQFSGKTRHSIHSPFLYAFVNNVLHKRSRVAHPDIEAYRNKLKSTHSVFPYTDFGKDGQVINRKVSDVARASLKPRMFAEMIARCCAHLKVRDAIELGTSFGLTSAYIARNITGTLHTYEGDNASAEIAQQGWKDLGLENITLIPGNMDETLLNKPLPTPEPSLVFMDGNHRKAPTLAYFKHLIRQSGTRTVFVIDDIHWSPGMEEAWEEMKQDPKVTASLDCYFMGFLFLNPELSREHFHMRLKLF